MPTPCGFNGTGACVAIHPRVTKTRILALLAAIVVPGGLIALFGIALYSALKRHPRGQRALDVARRSVPAWAHGRARPLRAA